VVYDNYKATKVTTERLTLKNNHLDTKLNMELNGAPVETVFDVDIAVDESGGPYIEAELHASNVPVTHVMRKGRFSGLLTVDVDKAKGVGLNWNETLKKTLTANGNIKVEQGRVSAIELLSTIFMVLGHPGREYNIDLLTSDFNIQNERVSTRRAQIKGRPFDMELSGWVGFDKQIDYNAAVLLPQERAGKDTQKIFDVLGEDSTILLRLTGRLPKPNVQIRGEAALERILEGVFRGPKETPKKPEEAPKEPEGPETLFEAILKGIPREPEEVPREPEGAPKKPAEAPKEPQKEPGDVPEDTEKMFKELEDVFKDIFK
ncbi:MAG: AsmA-like C-terminal region-containing protein, partial [Candidatus Brocadiales bacterium]